MALTSEQIKSLDALTEERYALSHLMGSKGWTCLKEHCAKTSAFAYEQMAKSDNPTVMAKQVGAWHVAESVIHYPEQRLAQINALINALEQAARGPQR